MPPPAAAATDQDQAGEGGHSGEGQRSPEVELKPLLLSSLRPFTPQNAGNVFQLGRHRPEHHVNPVALRLMVSRYRPRRPLASNRRMSIFAHGAILSIGSQRRRATGQNSLSPPGQRLKLTPPSGQTSNEAQPDTRLLSATNLVFVRLQSSTQQRRHRSPCGCPVALQCNRRVVFTVGP